MRMNLDNQLEQLENAILHHAQTLAQNQAQATQQQCDKIRAESANRLQLWEQRETAKAKEMAEHVYRRQVQASELKMQAELDQLRWDLVQSVITQLKAYFTQLCEQRPRYVTLLKQYLTYAIHLLENETLVVEVQPRDYEWLKPQWEALAQEIVPVSQSCTLIESTHHFTGGLLVRDALDRVRVDVTFEGLMNRLEDELYQAIVSQLFASTLPLRTG